MNSRLYFDIYGFKILIQSNFFNLLDLKLYQDFKFFNVLNLESVHLVIDLNQLSDLNIKGFRIAKNSYCEVRQISFNSRQFIYRQQGQALANLIDNDFSNSRHAHLEALNAEVVDDVLYFYINSTAGEYLDSVGLMRIHAFSFLIEQSGVLVWGRPKAGKSTLALKVLNDTTCPIYSDEISIFDINNKTLLPFPIRLASSDIAPEKNSDSKFSYFFKTKKLIELPFHRIAVAGPLAQVFVISKEKIKQFSNTRLSIELILGIGLIQMAYFLVRPSNFTTLFRIFKNRVKLCIILSKHKIRVLYFYDSIDKKMFSIFK